MPPRRGTLGTSEHVTAHSVKVAWDGGKWARLPIGGKLEAALRFEGDPEILDVIRIWNTNP
jgi:hypothetical protein